jgi:hypothetical protein
MHHDTRLIANGAVVALAGYVTSGLGGTLLVQWLRPQPAWSTAKMYVANYHLLQAVPFFFGFMLVGGMLMLAAGHYLNADSREKPFTLLSLTLTSVFATLIFFNYIVQTTYLRGLALNYTTNSDTAINMLSMSNPLSLCWAIEMWGYAVLGIATWLLHNYYNSRNKTTAILVVANGIVSIASALAEVYDARWVFTLSGFIGYAIWNLLMIVLMIKIYLQARKEMSLAHQRGRQIVQAH